MPLTTNSIIESVAAWLDGPELAEVVFHHFVQAPGTDDEPIALFNIAQELRSLWDAFTYGAMTPTTQFVGVSSRVLPPGNGSGVLLTSYSTVVGGVSGEVAGAQQCVLLSKYSADTSRRGRGRAYLPFVPESYLYSGRLTVTAKDTLTTLLDPIFLDEQTFDGITIDPCIYSRADGTHKEITFTILRSVTATIRRRATSKQPFYEAP